LKVAKASAECLALADVAQCSFQGGRCSANRTGSNVEATAPREPIPEDGPSLADCLDIWEPATHMSKAVWRSTSVRTLNGIDLNPTQVTGTEPASKLAAMRHAQLSPPSRHAHYAHAHGTAAESSAC
jgi:hypothetical protein